MPDIVIAVHGEPNLLVEGRGNQRFGSPEEIGAESDKSQSVQLIDLDGDGDLDAVFGNSDGSSSTYHNNDGVLGPVPEVVGKRSTESDGLQLVADFNDDGFPTCSRVATLCWAMVLATSRTASACRTPQALTQRRRSL